jgi:hypothetical protein
MRLFVKDGSCCVKVGDANNILKDHGALVVGVCLCNFDQLLDFTRCRVLIDQFTNVSVLPPHFGDKVGLLCQLDQLLYTGSEPAVALHMEGLPIGLSLPRQFIEVGCILSWELRVLKAKLHCREGAVTWEIFHCPDKVGWFNLLGQGLRFLKNRTVLLQEVILRSRSKDTIKSQDCITLTGLELLNPEEDATAMLPLVDNSQEEIFGVLVRSHRQREIPNGITELLLAFLGLSLLLLLFKGISAVA